MGKLMITKEMFEPFFFFGNWEERHTSSIFFNIQQDKDKNKSENELRGNEQSIDSVSVDSVTR